MLVVSAAAIVIIAESLCGHTKCALKHVETKHTLIQYAWNIITSLHIHYHLNVIVADIKCML